MLIDKFVSYIVREQAKEYLHFNSCDTWQFPRIDKIQSPSMLYVHIPFCEELCTYCSFHKVAFHEGLAREYFTALRKEIVFYQKAGYDFKALYIGGGTPTILIDELAKTINLIKKCFCINEISVETNPNHLDTERIHILKDLGVKRLSVGVQTFNNDILKTIGRYNKYGSGEEISEKIKTVQGHFPTLNIDMMFNFPQQTEAMLRDDLGVLQRLKVDQVTYYPLMMSTTTQKAMELKMGAILNQRGRTYYEIITAALKNEYRANTAWCFSRDDSLVDEYVVNYDEYAGLGSGAFGYLNGIVYANSFDIPEYIKRVGQGKFPVVAQRKCNFHSALLYDFLMQFFGLSIDLNHLRKKHGLYGILYLLPIIVFFMAVGGIRSKEKNGDFISTNPYLGVIMMREFFSSVNNFRDFCRSRAKQSDTEKMAIIG